MVSVHLEKPCRPGLAIYLFGRPEFRLDDEPLPPLATRKTESLLAYLILNRQRPHSRDELATLFWGDRDDAHARHSLATALWRIRRLLGEDYLLTDAASVQFNPASSFWLDVAEFETHLNNSRSAPDEQHAAGALRQAVALYRGDLLEGCYDDWCLEERYHLEGSYLDALSRLVVWHETQGNASEVLACAREYLAHDPLAENIHLALMRALVALGDLAGARRQWQRCCETRQQELHLPPSPEMLAQAEDILGARFIVPLPTQSHQARTSPRGGSLECPPFVGRAREIEALHARWQQATQGHGGIILIGGAAGVGKTRLAEEFAARVRWHGGIVAHAHCYELERLLPYQPLVEVLRDLTLQEERIALTLPAWARRELSRLVPELGEPAIRHEFSSDYFQREQQGILFQAIAAFIHQFALRAPLLIVFEDLQWATDSVLAALQYLVHHTAALPVLCLATFRTEEIGETHALTTMATQLAHDGLAQHLALEALQEEALAELVQRTLKADADPEFVHRLYTHTEGNAFFTIETLRVLGDAPLHEGPLPVPGNVRALIASRLGHLSPLAREWITYAAVAGRAFDFDLIRLAKRMDEDTALQAVDELLQCGLLREGKGRIERDYEFVHHLVQNVTYAAIHHRRRQRLHRTIGETMEDPHADAIALAGTLAHHFDVGGVAEKALRYYGLAAQQATAVFAWQEAEQYQGRMLHLLDQLDPRCTRADCLHRRQQVLTDRAAARFLQARLAERDADLAALDALAEVSGDVHVRLQALSQRARYLNLDAQYEKAIAVAEEGLPLADQAHDTAAQCYLMTQIGFAHYFLGQPQPALTALESALAMAPEPDRETRRHITHILGYVHFHLGNYARSVAYLQASYADHQALGDYNGLAWAGLDIGAAYREMGRLTEAEQYLTEHLRLAQHIGARSAEAYGLVQLGSWELCRGHYVTAGELFQQALSAQQALRTEHGRVAAELGTGLAFYHLGDVPNARHWLEQAIERARRIQHRRRLMEALIGLGLVEIAVGQPSAARADLTEAVDVARNSESQANLAAGLAALARAERRLGNLAAACAYAAEAVQIAREIAVPIYELWGELELGLARLAQGDVATALAHNGRAVDLLPQNDESWITTEQVRNARARILRAAGRMQEAEEQARLAAALVAVKAEHIPNPQQLRIYLESPTHDP
ncbi:MAG: AAA family ATPase [Anaerolineae bacterium]|nr:AAA family ATPase [Anaerolineae bacterium]